MQFKLGAPVALKDDLYNAYYKYDSNILGGVADDKMLHDLVNKFLTMIYSKNSANKFLGLYNEDDNLVAFSRFSTSGSELLVHDIIIIDDYQSEKKEIYKLFIDKYHDLLDFYSEILRIYFEVPINYTEFTNAIKEADFALSESDNFLESRTHIYVKDIQRTNQDLRKRKNGRNTSC